MGKKKRKVNSLLQEIINDIPLSGPAPDEDLITVGQTMYWSPNSEIDKDVIKDGDRDDIMMSIL